jgi:hypothetical protein
MAEQSKAAQRSTLILQLGRLLAPIYELAERSTSPTSEMTMVKVACPRALQAYARPVPRALWALRHASRGRVWSRFSLRSLNLQES